MMKKIIPFLMAIFLVIPLMAEMEVKLGDVENAPPGTVNVPLILKGFDDPIAAITLYIEYDQNLLSYQGNNLLIAGSSFFISPNYDGNSVIKLVWTSIPSKQIDDEELVEFVFNYAGGFETDLEFVFLDGWEIAGGDDEPIPFTLDAGNFTPGKITPKTTDPDGSLTIESVAAVVNETINVPVTASGFTSPAAYAVELFIAYDTQRLEYLGYDNDELDFGEIVHQNGIIHLLKEDVNSIKLDGIQLIELEFKYIAAGEAKVEFQPGSFVSNIEGENLHARFHDGVVNVALEVGKLTIGKSIATCEEFYEEAPPFGEEPEPDPVSVVITADDLSGEDLGMITLKMYYDHTKLDYTGYTANQFPGMWSDSFNPATGELIFTITLAESSGSVLNILDGDLLTLEFDYLCNVPEGEDGQADINFVTGTLLQRQAPDLGLVLPALVDGFVNTYYELNVTVFLEGLYDGNGLMREALNENSVPQWGVGIADHIKIELHDANDYNIIVYDVDEVELMTDGTASVLIPSIYNESYYITIRHRNSIETTTAVPVSFSSTTINYDFTTAASQAFGDNQKDLGDGSFAIFGGDVNQDGFVDTADFTLVDNDNIDFAEGYLVTDVNGDGFIDTADFSIIDDNNNNFVEKLIP